MAVPDFKGDLEGYLKWAKDNHKFNPHWCSKHWAPCPVEGKPGALASIILMMESFAFLPPDVTEPTAINSWWANQTVPVCCRIGDGNMAWLWDYISSMDKLCMVKPVDAPGRHSCFYLKGHSGEHDWAQPPKSIFDYM